MDGLDQLVEGEIVLAAALVGRWFEERNIETWQLGPVCSRNHQEQRDALLAAIRRLMDVQNGPPLISWQDEWTAAMDAARDAVKAAEGDES